MAKGVDIHTISQAVDIANDLVRFISSFFPDDRVHNDHLHKGVDLLTKTKVVLNEIDSQTMKGKTKTDDQDQESVPAIFPGGPQSR